MENFPSLPKKNYNAFPALVPIHLIKLNTSIPLEHWLNDFDGRLPPPLGGPERATVDTRKFRPLHP